MTKRYRPGHSKAPQAVGGRARARKLSAAQRHEIAMMGARAAAQKEGRPLIEDELRIIPPSVRKEMYKNAAEHKLIAELMFDPPAWMQHFLINYESGDPFVLYPAQETFLREAFSPNPETLKLKYDTVIFAAPKKSGKCLEINELVTLANGQMLPAGDLMGRTFDLLTLDATGRPIRVSARAALNAIEPVYRLTTDSGWSVVRNAEHPFFIGSRPQPIKNSIISHGFCPLSGIRKGNLIAVAEHIPAFGSRRMREEEVKLLAYMIADGCCTRGTPVYVKPASKQAYEFRACARALGCIVSHPDSLTWRARGKPREAGNPLRQLLDVHGLYGKRAEQKHIPKAVYSLPKRQLALFLSRLFGGDGWANSSPTKTGIRPEIGYSTASKPLAMGIKHLLARFGIHARYRAKPTKCNGVSCQTAHVLYIHRVEDVERFAKEIGMYGKEAALAKTLKAAQARKSYDWVHHNAPPGCRWEKVKSIRKLAPSATVAIEVPNHHTFITPLYEHNTALAAMCLLYVVGVLGGERAEGYIVSNSREQASDRVFADCCSILKASPQLAGFANVTNDAIEFPATNSFIKTVTTEASSAAGSRPTIVVGDEIWGFCVDLYTTFLTRRGWVTIDTVRPDDEFATLSAEGALEWQRATHMTKRHYKGPMYRFKHRRVDFLVTPNHRVFGKFTRDNRKHFRFEDNDWSIRTAAEAANVHHGWLKGDAAWKGKERKSFTLPGVYAGKRTYFPAVSVPADAFMKVAGWALAEGWVSGNTLYIAQSKSANPQNHAEIGHDLRRLGLGTPRSNANGWRLRDPRLAAYFRPLGRQNVRYVPQELKECSARQLELLLLCYLRGDGWVAGKDSWQFCTVSKRLLDDILEIGLKCGWHPRYMNSRQRPKKHQVIYRGSLSHGRIRWEKHGKHWSIEQYDGMIWCPTVPNGVVYAQRNGKCCWTGNSSARSVRLWDELAPTPTALVSVRLIVTYAGYTGESELLEKYYRRIFAEDGTLNPGVVQIATDLYAQGRTLVYWTHEMRAPWQTPEWVETMRREYSPNQFARIMENRWVNSESSFIEATSYDRCVDRQLRPAQANKGMRVWVGLDASLRRDSTAIVAVALDTAPEAETASLLRTFRERDVLANPILEIAAALPWAEDYTVKENPMTLSTLRLKLVWHRIFVPQGRTINFAKIEEAILLLHRSFDVSAVAYDPTQMVAVAQGLTRFGVKMVELPATQANSMAFSSLLRDLIEQNRLRVYPADDLRQHVLAAASKESQRGWHIVKQSGAVKIDAAVALAEACHVAARYCAPSEVFMSSPSLIGDSLYGI